MAECSAMEGAVIISYSSAMDGPVIIASMGDQMWQITVQWMASYYH